MRKENKPAVNPADILVSTIDDALALLRSSSYGEKALHAYQDDPGSLLEQCIVLCEKNKSKKLEPIRTIHHFACTGGTLLCKCLAVMPNTQLLSEVDPLSVLGTNDNGTIFAPTDMITLLRQSTCGGDKELILKMFLNNVEIIYKSALHAGKRLVFRDHSHSHYCVGGSIPDRQHLRQILKLKFPVLSVVTVRDPMDSYLSLLNNDWVHFTPETFDEYCRRYLIFIESYNDVAIVRYEDFVNYPNKIMKDMCRILDLPYADDFADLFDVIKLSGDSGRRSGTIEPRERRPVGCELEEEASASPHYMRLREMLGYYG
ncbi:MAG: sulfotransferase family protein [gamma proteobacterium endosymbiont of Lamellibrachia anaximandri]|nr:sulfotransferase family protein [gamma proteobacterium endosymbiont of Lamellibrachia anaximandri]MBL3534071.1 sulfotransferase family protein [gamma proteobacterium endosymbiont of Lamellibrachia anaximandri]